MKGCILLLLCMAILPANSKVVSGLIELSSVYTESYISKFSFSHQTPGYIAGRFYTTGGTKYFDGQGHDLTFSLYDDEAWVRFHDAFQKGTLCLQRRAMATWTTRIQPAKLEDAHNPDHGEDFYFEVEVPTREHRAHYWYAVMMDCHLEQYDAHPAPIVYEIEFFNGNSHLPADEDGLPMVCFAVLIGLSMFGVLFTYLVSKQWKLTGQIHLIVLLFGLAYVAQTASIACELYHLHTYSLDGRGLRFRHTWLALDFAADLLQGISELIISFVLICMAFGWTLTAPVSLIAGARQSGIMGGLAEIFGRPADLGAFLVFASILFVQVILQILGRQYEDDFTQFHDYEHAPGYTLMAMRVFLCLAFWLGTMTTIRGSRDANVAGFLGRLTLLGTTWFLAFPVLVVCTAFLPPYNRHSVVTSGAITMQSFALCLFLYMFLSRSEYYKISSLSKMGTLFQTNSGGMAHGKKLATD
eukprot:CAMPEP_0174286196 /NCGR_PEP_ID=MMETSP0809-20121228/10852_1 /TAXON_ID=73025 ORGANISM="Eutreptiella gymnastica-like, Strain CCMP1594" /NCGR_SAMPLE_ID=MMETSP0809 /ASSEMBLY_ACC=CAM_ASM_000658 /LENGTH=469 /DNA_ID=CAMNT_0015382173 /DNA_START=39 /DNA_END=1448 /DNA_ORIENTATION=+